MKANRFLGGILLVAGTAIGAGMIALPITSGMGGFFPSMVLLISCWLYMTTTAFLFLEATLWYERDVNLVSIAEHTLGIIGKGLSWVVYLFLLYSLTTAYLSGCGALFLSSLDSFGSVNAPTWIGPLPFLFLFGFCVYLGTKSVDYINRALMLGMVVTFAIIAFIAAGHVQSSNLSYQSWPLVWPSLAIMVTSFGFHIIIPSLSYYLGYRVDILKKTLFYGSLVPLAFYIIWEFFTLGIIPFSGSHSFMSIAQSGQAESTLIGTLSENMPGYNLVEVLRFFSYFIILTSFLGVTLSLSDFLADGFKIKKNHKGRALITLLTFLPPLFFSLSFPNVFIAALKYAAIFIALLLGILPAAIVWSGRYRLKMKSDFKVVGGKFLLILVILISISVIFIDVIDQLSHT